MQSTRTTPRFPFEAPAKVSQGKKAGRSGSVRDISLYGCYLEFNSPYPAGTQLLLRIFSQDGIFESSAIVIYARPKLGMGLGFKDIKPQSVHVLEEWLVAAMRRRAEDFLKSDH
jgi:PilZ domain-containing protein